TNLTNFHELLRGLVGEGATAKYTKNAKLGWGWGKGI
ncbi:MAG: hypothetical protein ACI9NQ_000912, partial [Paracoccaceae bacterium]